jgi:nucleotide-binding universal stress UspA family protein
VKLLICTDGLVYAERAVRLGADFARALDANVTVLHVCPPASVSDPMKLAMRRRKVAEWSEEIPGVGHLERAARFLSEKGLARPLQTQSSEPRHIFRKAPEGGVELHLLGHGAERVRLKLREGNAAEEILKEAQEGSYDLIITGSRGHHGDAPYYVGSTALRMAEFAPCSVLIAKNVKDPQRFLICTDGSGLAEQAELFGANIAQALSAGVTVLTVASDEGDLGPAKERVRRAEMVLSQTGRPAPVKVRLGRPSEEIIAEAKDHDIVVMGASGSSAVRRFFLGSVPLKVIEYGECSVLLVREKRVRSRRLPKEKTPA